MDHDPGSLRNRLRSGTESAWRLYCALELTIPYKNSVHNGPISRQRLVASTIPWNGSAAALTQELHEKIRRFEVHMQDIVTGIRGVRRGGSDANTRFALKAVANLAEAPVMDDQTVLGVLNYLDGWVHRAETFFEPDKGLRRLPREPGEKEARCPWCAYQTLRWHPSSGIVVCVNPECRTEGGTRPRWAAEYGIDGDVLRFSWQLLEDAA